MEDHAVTGGMSDLRAALARSLIGSEMLIERLTIGLLAGGHLLVEGAPGLAKTRAVKALAAATQGSFARIQCTPDLMPADLTGTQVWRPDAGRFDFLPGPVFHNLVLVDEINRAPPKVQSALLEAMAEGQVTSGNETHALPDPMLVVATQNPIEHDGTYPLPEAQLDRFLFHVLLHHPDAAQERAILDLVETEGTTTPAPPPVQSLADLRAARAEVAGVFVSEPLKDYIVRLVVATRDPARAAQVEHAVSPRGSIGLMAAARARAWLHGRDHAVPEDVAALAGDVLSHRLIPTWSAQADGLRARDIVAEILAQVDPL